MRMLSTLRKRIAQIVRPHDPPSVPDVVSIYDGDTGQAALVDHFEIAPAQRLESVVDGATPVRIERHREAKVGLVLKNVLVWPEVSVAAFPEGQLIAETLPAPQYRVAKLIRFGAFDETTPTDEVEAIASIGCGYWTNYYHKLIDEIPRLHPLVDGGHHGELDVWIPSYYDPGFMDLVRALAPESTSFVQVETSSRPVFARRYVHIPMLSNNFCGHLPRFYVRWLRSRLNELFSAEDPRESPRRIYVSRSQASHRQIENESEVQNALSQSGYEVHHPETRSPLEQAKLFRGAEQVAGVHGAGLANILYASDAHLLEFFPTQPLYHYRWLSESCGHAYQNITPENPQTDKHGNFALPVKQLKPLLRKESDRPSAGTTSDP
jgi:hypothetical protein